MAGLVLPSKVWRTAMLIAPVINLGNALLSLSDAMDLADRALASHQQRTAFVAWELGKVAKLTPSAMKRVFSAALLHDVGALTLEEKLTLHDHEVIDIDTHCILGEILFKSVPWLQPSAGIVRFHHRNWADWDDPIDDPLVLESQIVLLADLLERTVDRTQYILHQRDRVTRKLVSASGTMVHPRVLDMFMVLQDREEFWLDLVSPRLYSLLLHSGPYKAVEVDLSYLRSFSEFSRDIIDLKSRFTATHSSGVAACAAVLSEMFGFSELEVELMEIAGNFHDLGKLVVPNNILDKVGGLTGAEIAVMKQHTYYTFTVLNSVMGLGQLAEWAAFHHEKLDGSGYPFHRTAGELTTGARIMAAADMFTALAEDRPYRKGMGNAQIRSILRQQANDGLLDAGVVKLLLDGVGELAVPVREKEARTRRSYELRFAHVLNLPPG
ncbi:HD domain-containing protein [bacterium]|nr:HD domain-containing protein [bacterium]